MHQFLKGSSAALRRARRRLRALTRGQHRLADESNGNRRHPENRLLAIEGQPSGSTVAKGPRALIRRETQNLEILNQECPTQERALVSKSIDRPEQFKSTDQLQSTEQIQSTMQPGLNGVAGKNRTADAHGSMNVGQFVHDLDNLLSVIANRAELAQSDLKFDRRCAHSIRAIQLAAKRALGLSALLRKSDALAGVPKSRVDLNQVIQATVESARSWMPPNISIIEDVPSHIPVPVYGNATQLGRVVQNLLSNAVESLRSGGHVFVSLDVPNRCPARPYLNGKTASSQHAQSLRAVLKVRDTGVGMDAQTARRAFETGFSTKRSSSGSGLGLSIVADVVSDHGGTMALESTIGRGTEVRVEFPMFQNDERCNGHD